MGMFARARANLNLTPAERALLRLVKLCLVAGLVAALPILAQALSGQALDWATVGRTALAAFSVAALGALLKWLTSQADAPLPDTSAPPAVPGGTTSGA
ncbi:MAG TPA: hypothetical protein VGR57_09400 [Ktedonobacterales bacterium]|nr:hypothetical protein [Ktedonobacterales bacterium]